MQEYFSEASFQRVSAFWCVLLIIGLFVAEWVRILPSVGVAGLFLTSTIYAYKHPDAVRNRQYLPYLSLTGVFGLHIFSALARGSLSDSLVRQDLVLQSPFLLLPIAFSLLPNWLIRYKQCLWLLLIGCCLFSALGATINYLLHSQQIEKIYLQSKVMPTEPDHIRFSLLISIAVIVGLVMLIREGDSLSFLKRVLIPIAIILLFLFQHLLAVRSGLVSMYVAGMAWIGWLGIQMRYWKAVLTILTSAFLLAGISLLFFPTLQNKIINTRSDTEQIAIVQSANNYSVTARVYSYEVASVIIRQHPWLGVGKIGLANKMAIEYSYMFPEIESDRYVLPHNQFIYNLAAYGIIGLIIFLISFYYPVLYALRRGKILFLLIYLIVSLSFLVEYTLESHIGLLISIFFALLSLAPEEGDSTKYRV
ncbi:hypothetical protein GO988_10145 [Hymenobacter sp. HMF4947]|uniref:O-antigen ligase-related domain-containing protein n=1 Tax=Hymenobacter ginkgonis TaxID=2682976 RepID=A0A7K1TE63_9BACT|nr:O-antigen ligase family protein [Hymenobacter ginkgonis]MVN76680.1 hypothetical protein [Hymenobacter ginkgonis]